MRINFDEVSVKAVKRWTDESGRKRQETRKFYQTVNPYTEQSRVAGDCPNERLFIRRCETERESWNCKNMKPIENDTSMTHEYYKCEVCGRRMTLDYDEMR